MAEKGDWALIKSVVLLPSGRAPQVPEDTRATPLLQWVKGRLQMDANIGETVSVKTRTGRVARGELIAINPSHTHTFGELVPELILVQESIMTAFRELQKEAT